MTADPIEHIPPPDVVKAMLADSVRRSTLLRSLLRVSRRKANYPPPDLIGEAARLGLPLTTGDKITRPAPQAAEVSVVR